MAPPAPGHVYRALQRNPHVGVGAIEGEARFVSAEPGHLQLFRRAVQSHSVATTRSVNAEPSSTLQQSPGWSGRCQPIRPCKGAVSGATAAWQNAPHQLDRVRVWGD